MPNKRALQHRIAASLISFAHQLRIRRIAYICIAYYFTTSRRQLVTLRVQCLLAAYWQS